MTSREEDCQSVLGGDDHAKMLCRQLEDGQAKHLEQKTRGGVSASALVTMSDDRPAEEDARTAFVTRVRKTLTEGHTLANPKDADTAVAILRQRGATCYDCASEADTMESLAQAHIYGQVVRAGMEMGDDPDLAIARANEMHVVGRTYLKGMQRLLAPLISRAVRDAGIRAVSRPPLSQVQASGWHTTPEGVHSKRLFSRTATVQRQGAGPGWVLTARDGAFPNAGRWVHGDRGSIIYDTLAKALRAGDDFLQSEGDAGSTGRGDWLPLAEYDMATVGGMRLRSVADKAEREAKHMGKLAERFKAEQRAINGRSLVPREVNWRANRAALQRNDALLTRAREEMTTVRLVPNSTDGIGRPSRASTIQAAVRRSVGLPALTPPEPVMRATVSEAVGIQAEGRGGMMAGGGHFSLALPGQVRDPHTGLTFVNMDAYRSWLAVQPGNTHPVTSQAAIDYTREGSHQGLQGQTIADTFGTQLREGNGPPKVR